jgi:heavy metal translocating P-type ATPase
LTQARSWDQPRSPIAQDGEEEPSFCCLGCQFADEVAQERLRKGPNSSPLRGVLARLGLAIVCTLNVSVFSMALWTIDVYGEDPSNRMANSFHDVMRILALLSSLPVYMMLGPRLLQSAWRDLSRWRPTTDLLLALGVLASLLVSGMSVIRGRGPVHVEAGCVILVTVTIGRWLEAHGRLRSQNALEELARLIPETVRRVDANGLESMCPLAELAIGDRIRVLPGERLGCDGRIVRGRALVDQSTFTGESRPVEREAGDAVTSGVLNLDGDLLIEVAALPEQGALQRLVELVQQARRAKTRWELLADRVSRVALPVVLLVAIIAGCVHGLHGGADRGLLIALAVLVIACPCALALATPMAVSSALGLAAQKQVLVRTPDALERLSQVRSIAFDKTGTLTTGMPRVIGCIPEREAERSFMIANAVALARSTKHVLSQAIAQHYEAESESDREMQQAALTRVKTEAGRGVRAERPGLGLVVLGSPRYFEELGWEIGPRVSDALKTSRTAANPVVLVGWGGQAQGLFVCEESLRAEAQAALKDCRALGLNVSVLTGDHADRARAIEQILNVPVMGELRPEAKVEAVRRAQRSGQRLAFVGDGINDAPAMAAADVGIALGCGADVTRECAALCITTDLLDRVPWSIQLARRTVSTIRWNLVWSFGYNAIGVIAAALGWIGPTVAALAMVASSFLVVCNSLRLGMADVAKSQGDSRPSEPPQHTGTASHPIPATLKESRERADSDRTLSDESVSGKQPAELLS